LGIGFSARREWVSVYSHLWKKELSYSALLQPHRPRPWNAFRLKPAQCIILKDLVFDLDERVRYFGFLDNRQGMVISELRESAAGDEHPGESQLVRDLTFFKGAMASWSLYFGRVKYSLVTHDTFRIILIPVESGLIIITAEASLPPEKVEMISNRIHGELLLGKV